MVHDALAFYDHLHGLVESVLKRSIVRALLQQSLGALGEYILDERRYVLKMIVKGVAVDSALLDDILYGYLVEGAGVKQLEKSLFYRLAGKGRHVVSSKKFLYIYRDFFIDIKISFFRSDCKPRVCPRRRGAAFFRQILNYARL